MRDKGIKRKLTEFLCRNSQKISRKSQLKGILLSLEVDNSSLSHGPWTKGQKSQRSKNQRRATRVIFCYILEERENTFKDFGLITSKNSGRRAERLEKRKKKRRDRESERERERTAESRKLSNSVNLTGKGKRRKGKRIEG